jgi:hypothetical protein
MSLLLIVFDSQIQTTVRDVFLFVEFNSYIYLIQNVLVSKRANRVDCLSALRGLLVLLPGAGEC